ncbi:LysR family transcriptional regulator [Pseudodesulfovibrio cashew]|uniref:LysR family transcriptional regulator n=1 Tax=Pseudodesulfovibrio cashew TaxID=2678688 RepID=A0A6I6JA09_9BACT|nr:LysR family transcriptional regulator [Pseudodesulfovibrio cashew]QGY39495.1 LysR family transcriptional regulator [Pseudodesulfovibrio cashew]
MELYQLKTFVAVAEEGNLTRAAERVFASQPAVSAHIKALEEELGLPLFVRTPRGMQLTDIGKGLKLKADSILLAAADMLDQANRFRKDLTGDLSVALNTDSEFLRISALVTTLAETHPGLMLKFHLSSSHRILKDLRDRRIDAGFSFFENHYAEVEVLKLKTMPVRIVAPAAWAARVEGKSVDQLAELPWIKPHDDCPFMQVMNGVFEDSGIIMDQCIGADSEDIIRELVAAGKGLSLIKEHDALNMVRAGTAVICETGPELSLNINFCYAKTRRNDPLIQALLDAVAAVWQDGDAVEAE